MSTPQITSSTTDTPLPEPPLPSDQPWALLLDVDGTLLEFADDPAGVVVGAALHDVLRALHAMLGGALALVSGRQLQDIDRLFGEPTWVAAGLHGMQLRDAGGVVHAPALDAPQLAAMRRAVHALAARFPAVHVEDKHAAIALHCRQAPALWPALHAACSALLPALPGYELQPGNLVLEFKPAGSDKGQAVRALLASPWAAGRTAVYLGDDLTDEHAFAAVNAAHGISVRVGQRTPTLARFTLPGPSAVQAWLHRVLAALTQESNA